MFVLLFGVLLLCADKILASFVTTALFFASTSTFGLMLVETGSGVGALLGVLFVDFVALVVIPEPAVLFVKTREVALPGLGLGVVRVAEVLLGRRGGGVHEVRPHC